MTTQRLLQFLSRSVAAVVFLFAFVGAQNAFAQTVFVSSTTGSDAFDGASATIAGGSGPKATLAGALAVAAAGNTISIEAGTYTEAFDFGAAAPSVSVAVTASGGVTAATFTGSSTMAPGAADTITLSSGSVVVQGGAFTLTNGSFVNNGTLSFSAPTTLTVTAGTMSGTSPSYTGAVTAGYTLPAAGSAGSELPSSLNGGTLTVNGGFDTTFGSALTAGAITTAATATGTTTFSGAVTVSGNILHNGDDAVFGAVNMTNGSITSTGGGANQTFTAGAVTFSQSAGGAAVNNTSATSTMTLASLTATGFNNNGSGAAPALETFAAAITNIGTLTVSGAIVNNGSSDANDNDVSSWSLTNSGTATIGASSSLSGALDNTGGTLALGNTTLTLTGAGPHVDMGTVTGATSTVTVSGASPVPASAVAVAPAVAIAGNLNISGNGGVTGAISVGGNVVNSGNGDLGAAVRTAGNLTNSGTGDINAAMTVGGDLTVSGAGADVGGVGSFDVAGGATFSGTTTINGGVGTNDVAGAVTVSGTLATAVAGNNANFGSANVTAAGTLTIAAGTTLTIEGDLNTSNGGTFNANSGTSTLAFLIPGGATGTFTAGPNTTIDNVTLTRSGATGTGNLTLGQSFAVDVSLTTNANTNVNLDNFLIRHSGVGATATVNGTIATAAGQSGALAFENTGQTLNGLGDISNILVNVTAGNTLGVGAATSIDFTGTLTLFSGGVNVAAGGDISPEGATAEVRRNSADATTTIAGSFNVDAQTYILTIYNNGAAVAGTEFAATGISKLNVEGTTTTYTTNLAATVGDIDTDAGTTLTNGLDMSATGTVTNAGTIAGAGDLTLTGASKTHSNTGGITADLVLLNTGITVNGNATIGAAKGAFLTNVTVGDAAATAATGNATLNNIQQIDGTVTVLADGTLALSIVPDDGAGGTGDGNEGRVDGAIAVNDGGSLTWNSNVVAMANITVGAAAGTASTFDFNGNTVFMATGATTFSADSDANLGTSGEVEADAAINVTTNSDGAVAPTSALPGLDADSPVTLTGATRVVGTTDIDAAVDGAQSLTLSGTVHINAPVTNNVTIIGTDVMVEGAETVTGTLTINATSVNFTGDAVAGADALTVTGLFTQTAGDVDLNGADLVLQGGADYTAGTYTAQASTDEIVFNTGGAIDLNGGNWTIPNAVFDFAMVIDGNAGTNADVLTIGNRLELSVNLTAGNNSGAATPTGTITLGDGSGTFYLDADGGNVVDGGADGTINYGADTWTVEYNGTATTDAELPNAIDTMIINAATQLADAKNTTVNTLDINAGALTIANAGTAAAESVTLNAGGSFTAGVNGSIAGAQGLSYGDTADYMLTYDAGSTTSDNLSWPAANTPDVLISPAGAGGGTVALHANRTATDLEVASGDTFDPVGFNITINGEIDLNGNPQAIQSSAGAPGSVVFAGSAAQTLDGGLWYNGGVDINNAAGLTLANGNLNVTDNNTNSVCTIGGGTNPLTLTAGTVTTGTNRVIICHQSTTDQGFNRNGTTQTGSIFGNVQATVDGTASPNTTDRVEFPLGDADGNYRPYAITFNTPNQLAADPVLTATYDASSPMGTNGLPIATTDLQSNAFNVGRYPEFHWSVNSSPTVTPSVDYDVEFRAAGYANFAGEDIERTRAIRRADGSNNNFWILSAPNAADNDNFAASATEPVAVARNAEGAISGDGVLFTFGLETNLSATDPAALTLNAGNSEVIDLTTVFDGGGASYTYTVTGADGAVVTTAIAGDNLTVTGAGAGSDTFTVTIDDGFQSVDATVTVTVNTALAAAGGLSDVTVAGGSADADVDASGDFSGGTAPYTYSVATSDAAVVTVVVSAGGVVTHTFVGAGTATVTVTQTDSEGDAVNSSFDVTVNGGLAAAGGLAAVTLEEGNDDVTDVTGEFSGGNGAATFTYTASSSDTDVATVAVSGTDVTVTGVSPYVVASGAVTGDAGAATITVTATDDLGAATTSTFTVTVTPKLGNVDGSGGPSPASASAVLNNFLGLPGSTLTANQATAADYNMDAAITPFDAALIFDAFFNGKVEIAANPNVEVAYGELVREDNIITIPVQMTGDLSDVVSGHFSTQIDPAFATIIGVTTELGDGWLINHTVSEDGAVLLAFAGFGDIESSGTIANIAIELTGSDVQFNLGGEGAANNNATMSIDAVEVAELPETFALHGNYPNPFNPTTSINFDLPESADVEIHVIDMIGRQVMTLPATTIAAGANRTVQVNASQLASGPYFYRVIAKMESKTLVETGRMMLVK